MILNNVSRWQAFLIHFSISILIFLVLLYLILVHWYPQPFFQYDGGWRVIRIIIGVDLVLGPLLTLIVFKPGKAGLKFDLTVIALVQASALSWGVWTTYNERPAAIIYTLDFFTPVPANQLKQIGVDNDTLKSYGDSRPVLIYSDIPENKVSRAFLKTLRTQTPIYLQSEYYSKFTHDKAERLKNASMDLKKYVEDKPKLKQIYQEGISGIDLTPELAIIPLHSREKWVTVIFDTKRMKYIKTIEIDPFAFTQSQK